MCASILCACLVYLAHYYFWAEHIVYEIKDAKTRMNFQAVCQYSEYSYRTYVVVTSPGGRVISRNEIPYSADTLSDCTREPYYAVTSLIPSPEYDRLLLSFASDKRSSMEVPLVLKEIDLPFPPTQEPSRTSK